VIAHGAASTIYNRGYKYIFGVLNSIDHYTYNMVKMAAEQKLTRLALLNRKPVCSAQLGIDGVRTAGQGVGVEVVYKEKYSSGTKDLSPELEKMKAAKPDMIIAGGYTNDMILLARQIGQVGLKPKLLGLSPRADLARLREIAERRGRTHARAGAVEHQRTVQGPDLRLDGARICRCLPESVRTRPRLPPRSSPRRRWRSTTTPFRRPVARPAEGARRHRRDRHRHRLRAIRFNDKGQNIAKSMSVVQIQDGKPVVVYPADVAEGKLKLNP
jgi:branched-chain amino acid transport system substrate-binding protein